MVTGKSRSRLSGSYMKSSEQKKFKGAAEMSEDEDKFTMKSETGRENKSDSDFGRK